MLLFRDDTVNAFADGDDVHDLQTAEVCFSRDVLLQDGSEGTGEQNAEEGKDDCQREEQESRQCGFVSSKREPG